MTAAVVRSDAAPRDGASPLVEISGLTIRFGPHGQPVVSDLALTVARGECLALVGESGSGKSVTARTVVGLTGPTSQVSYDRLRFDGEDMSSLTEQRWRRIRGARIGFVLQDALSSLDGLRTVGREIAEPLRLHTTLSKDERAAKVLDLLRSVGVPEPELRARQYPHELSGGLRQRALIASAIACGPELLVADEPTTALDTTVQAQVLALLESLRSASTAMLIVSHDLAVVARLSDRVAVMKAGQIVEQGPTAQVLSAPDHPYTRSLLAAIPADRPRGTRLSAGGAVSSRATTSARKAAVADVATTGQPVIRAEGLGKSYPGPDGGVRRVVDDVSFDLRAGETLGVVGESGSGKTTTARLVLGVEVPDAGTVRVDGESWTAMSAADRRGRHRLVQVVYQDPLSSFDPRHTVERVLGEAVAVALPGSRSAREARLAELMDLVHLDSSLRTRRPLELSGGQRQRVAIARALAPAPKVVVCDEPVSALDVSVQARILDLLDELQDELGLSYLFISHDLGVVTHISDRVLVMKDGSVVESGDAQTVLREPRHPYTQELVAAVPRLTSVRS